LDVVDELEMGGVDELRGPRPRPSAAPPVRGPVAQESWPVSQPRPVSHPRPRSPRTRGWCGLVGFALGGTRVAARSLDSPRDAGAVSASVRCAPRRAARPCAARPSSAARDHV